MESSDEVVMFALVAIVDALQVMAEEGSTKALLGAQRVDAGSLARVAGMLRRRLGAVAGRTERERFVLGALDRMDVTSMDPPTEDGFAQARFVVGHKRDHLRRQAEIADAAVGLLA